ncbi:hypothetical protein FOL46_002094, partial [Perkinsus olseni]
VQCLLSFGADPTETVRSADFPGRASSEVAPVLRLILSNEFLMEQLAQASSKVGELPSIVQKQARGLPESPYELRRSIEDAPEHARWKATRAHSFQKNSGEAMSFSPVSRE